jgi:hypothetical protein
MKNDAPDWAMNFSPTTPKTSFRPLLAPYSASAIAKQLASF